MKMFERLRSNLLNDGECTKRNVHLSELFVGKRNAGDKEGREVEIKTNEACETKVKRKLTLLKRSETMPDFHEVGIETGYRSPSHSFGLCITSLVQKHNETINIWTQLLPACYFGINLLLYARDRASPFILLYLFSTTSFLLTSACAHTFSCISPFARHVCFVLDYFGISFYSFGCACTYYAFALPPEFLVLSQSYGIDVCVLFLIFAVIPSVLGTYVCSLTRFWKPSFTRQIVRLSSFLVSWLYLAIPIAWRTLRCTYMNTPYNQSSQCLSAYYWKLQFLSSMLAGLFYVTHFPERIIPGRFDVFGHSHQIFHVFGASAAFNQFRALLVDHDVRHEEFISLAHYPSLSLALFFLIINLVCNLVIVRDFWRRLRCVYS